MKSLKKYNQVLFAMLGTIALLLLFFGGIVFIIDEFSFTNYDDNTLVVEEELDSLKELNLRNQIVSIEGIHTFDTASKTYIIPVYHKKLQNPLSRNKGVYGLLDTYPKSNLSSYGYGNYNNLILYDFNNAEVRVLLDQRINIDQYNIYSTENKSLIVFTGWSDDTNNDGKLSDSDFKKVFVYDHSVDSLKQVENSSYEILGYEYLKPVDKLIFTVRERSANKNKDDIPELLVYYSYKENSLIPLIENSVLNKIQDIIDK